MSSIGTIAIVGGGLAAAKAVQGVRAEGFDGQVVLLSSEPHLPYERPPLSKGYLLGHDELEKVFVHPTEWYDRNEIDLRLATSVAAIDPEAHVLATRSGRIHYDRLLITTGASARHLPMADQSGAPVAYLRTIEDSQGVKARLEPGRRVVVVGGGWIGLEVAAAARTAGCDVVVIEALDLPLVRVLGREVAEVVSALHRSHGVDVRTGAEVVDIREDAGRAVVHLADGESVTGDLLVVGVGVTPNAALAEEAGLETHNGIVVDEHLRTSHPDVFAAGDVANAYHPRLGRHIRVEHWDNAIQQGLTASRNVLGAHEAYERLPYFFTDQYDFGMEYVGNVGPEGYDEVVLRGDVPGRVFTAFWLKGERVLAGMHANDWDAIDVIRKLVGGAHVDAAALRDPGVPLDRLAS